MKYNPIQANIPKTTIIWRLFIQLIQLLAISETAQTALSEFLMNSLMSAQNRPPAPARRTELLFAQRVPFYDHKTGPC